MAQSSLQQRVNQSILVTSLVFASVLGYWSVSTFAAPSADAVVAVTEATTSSTTNGSTTSGGTFSIVDSSVLVGDTINLSLTNVGQSAISVTSATPYVITQNSVNVYTPIAGQIITQVPVGQKSTWQWDQRNNDGVQVAAGSYLARITFLDTAGVKQTMELPFTIKAPVTTATKQLPTSNLAMLIAGALGISGIAAYLIVRRPFGRKSNPEEQTSTNA